MSRRRLKGMITSAKMQETARVVVHHMKTHPLYGKRYRMSASFMAHNPGNTYHEGDVVVIEEHRPISKTKRWIIIERLGNKDTSAVPETNISEVV